MKLCVYSTHCLHRYGTNLHDVERRRDEIPLEETGVHLRERFKHLVTAIGIYVDMAGACV